MIRFLLTLCAVMALLAQPSHAGSHDRTLEVEAELLNAAIDRETPVFDVPAGVTGITVPHHLVAVDLIARGFWAASSGDYDRIILLGPDHFDLVDTPFGTFGQATQTVLGPVAFETGEVQRLLEQKDQFQLHPNPAIEHSIGVLLPFIAAFFPDVPVIPVVTSSRATPSDWATTAAILASMITERTLIIQSTDYAHYLDVGTATLRDQETLAMISASRKDMIAAMSQPDHMDAKAAQYIQMTLQSDVMASHAAVVAQANSARFGGRPDNTTSYIVTVYHPDPTKLSGFEYADQSRLVFGGDTLLGRYMRPLLQDADALSAILETVRRTTGGAPLILNLEGVLVAEHVGNAPALSHVMHANDALPVLRYLNVAAVNLANNHALDFGPDAAAQAAAILAEAGIRSVAHRQIIDLGPLRLLALDEVTRAGSFDHALCRSAAEPPLIAFLHWGLEYQADPRPEDIALAKNLADCGVSAIVGAHSHKASDGVTLIAGKTPVVYGLGNFLFDQSAAFDVSSALVELRVFASGTTALRRIPLPNLFELGHATRAPTD